jgi:hypothetical protein
MLVAAAGRRKTGFAVTCLPLIGCRSNLLKTRLFKQFPRAAWT